MFPVSCFDYFAGASRSTSADNNLEPKDEIWSFNVSYSFLDSLLGIEAQDALMVLFPYPFKNKCVLLPVLCKMVKGISWNSKQAFNIPQFRRELFFSKMYSIAIFLLFYLIFCDHVLVFLFVIWCSDDNELSVFYDFIE